MNYAQVWMTATAVVFNLYTGRHKKRATKLLPIYLPNIDQFQKFFHGHSLWTICNNVIIKYPTAP